MIDCPTCGAPAELVDEILWESTDGPILHIAISCLADYGHSYFGPLDSLGIDPQQYMEATQ